MATRFKEDLNKGLPMRFTLENGGFKLIGGPVKVQDNIAFHLAFIGFFRVYFEDFVPDVLWLVQKPTSLVISLKTVILGRLLKSFQKYQPYLTVEKINMQYDYTNRKKIGIGIQYYYSLEPQEKVKVVKFIRF